MVDKTKNRLLMFLNVFILSHIIIPVCVEKKNTSYKFLLDEVEANNRETSIIDCITEVVKES